MKQDISGLVLAVLLTKMIAQAIQNLSLRVAKPLWKRKGAISQAEERAQLSVLDPPGWTG